MEQEPNGKNINLDCGAMYPENMAKITKLEGADLGIALDGDADRVIFSDENGEIINGDQIIAVLAREMQKNNELIDNQVVGTLMSNLGLENYLNKLNIHLHRTNVGDRYILDKMIKSNSKLGEPSGHILLSDFAKTGDGLLTAIKILSLLKKSGLKASEFLRPFKPIPQSLKNLKNIDKNVLLNKNIISLVEKQQEELGKKGRILLRPSGTEDLIRIMVECTDLNLLKSTTEIISKAIIKENDNKVELSNLTKTVLVIAGSDPSGGAGIQADLKTLTSFGVYGMTAITALTEQNTRGVTDIFEIPLDFVVKQINCCLSDIGANAIKIGMMHNTELINGVYEALKHNKIIGNKKISIVLDPVMVAKGGHRLLKEDAVNSLKTFIKNTNPVLTPNIPEAEILTDIKINNLTDMKTAGKKIIDLGANFVVLKGGHMNKHKLCQIY